MRVSIARWYRPLRPIQHGAAHRDIPASICSVSRSRHITPGVSQSAEPPAIAFLIPQGLTITGVNTWALSVIDALRSSGRRAGAFVHGKLAGHGETLRRAGDDVVHLHIPTPADAWTEADLGPLTGAYARAAEALAPGGRVVFLPTRLDACFAAAALAAEREPDRRRVVLWQQVDSSYENALIEHHEPAGAALVGASRHLADSIAARCPHRASDVHHIPNAVVIPPERRARRETGAPLRLVYTGRLEEEQKRSLALIHLSDALDKHGVAHELRIAGDGPSGAELARRAATRPSVALLGPFSPAQISAELDHADVFVLPSRREGLSFSLLEAMAHGCVPILTRTRSGSDEAVEHAVTGWIVDAEDDERSVGDALARAVLDARRAGLSTLARAARARVVDRFSLTAHTEALVSLADSLFETPPRKWPHGVPRLARDTSVCAPAVASRVRDILSGAPDGSFIIHGAGAHTLRLREVLTACRHAVAALADDDRALWGTARLGWPVIDPATAGATGATDVLISSDLHEERIWDRRGVYDRQGLRVHRLYAPTPSTSA